jgi:hypothetical protein
MVLWSHGHYTVDVIIAYYVTTTLFWMYHTLANNANLKVTMNCYSVEATSVVKFIQRIFSLSECITLLVAADRRH